LDLASRRQGKPVRLVRKTGQTDSVQKLPKDSKHLKSLSTSEQTKPWSSKDFLAQRLFSTAHRAKPVRPVRETGQAGFSLDSQEEHSPRVNSSKTKPRSPETLPKSWLPSSHLLDYMEATECLKYPFLITRDTSPSRAY
jgi:hypothetical protein